MRRGDVGCSLLIPFVLDVRVQNKLATVRSKAASLGGIHSIQDEELIRDPATYKSL